ncbi:MAG: hypothetical protein ABMB14_12315, partial [Myxococcota bacterium]
MFLAWVLSSLARACGPGFADRLLDDRAAALLAVPDGTFADAVQTVVPPAPGTAFVPQDGRTAAEAEWEGLSFTELGAVQAMRSASTLAEAEALGRDLPDELRWYTAGAVAQALGDLDAALDRFARVRALPPAERQRRGAWAAYSAARYQWPEEAARSYDEVRTLVAGGAPDPLGLAVASFGEEARHHLDDGDVPGAVARYAAQAGYGSWSGALSLLFVARWITADDQRLAAALDDPLTARVLVTYAWTRRAELAATGVGAARLLAAVEARGIDRLPDGDRLAAVAYDAGQYDLAARALGAGTAGSTTPLAAWVRATLALRSGDLDAAAASYAEASAAFPVIDDDWDNRALRCRLDGERGVLALARGQYVDALRALYGAAGRGWADHTLGN